VTTDGDAAPVGKKGAAYWTRRSGERGSRACMLISMLG
jgi:hypothetical protein